jgi:hypothetical protein
MECLYDYRDTAQFIIHIDAEDFIVPRHFNSIAVELNYLTNQFPNAASFEFLRANSIAYSGQLNI